MCIAITSVQNTERAKTQGVEISLLLRKLWVLAFKLGFLNLELDHSNFRKILFTVPLFLDPTVYSKILFTALFGPYRFHLRSCSAPSVDLPKAPRRLLTSQKEKLRAVC